jgi:radical SAM superfamily enzyme YgiQ (UPF0313 family)
MRILLVKPKARLRTVRGLEAFTRLEPLELGYLAASVSPEDDVRIVDLRLERFAAHAFQRALRSFRPDLVGITGYSHEASSVKSLTRTIKGCLPKTTVVVGGHHATAAPEDYNIESIDAVVRGEGCAPFRAIVSALHENEGFEGTPGVLIPGSDFDGPDELGWPQFPDPTLLPTPRRDLFNPRSYRSVWATEHMENWAPLFPMVSMVRASWGCRMKCTFCVVPQLYGGQHKPRSADSVAEEIERAPARHIYFCDDENFIDESFAWELAEALAARKVRKRYFAWTRSTTVIRSPELLEQWRSIGLDAVFIGFEFIRDKDLRMTRKGATVAANERGLELLRSFGVAVHAAFMIRPEWSEDDFEELESYIRGMPPVECSFTVCTPSPGTEDYESIRHNLWVDDPYELHDCMHPLTPTALPLRRFSQRYAQLARQGTARTPVRLQRPLTRPQDLLRVARAESKYFRGFQRIYLDYPKDLRKRQGPVELARGVS